MKEKSKLGVALIKELCPICTKEVDSQIVINTVLTENKDEAVKEMDGQNIWSKTLCPECQEMKSKGFVLIGAVEAKTTDVTNPYRSGNIWVVMQEVADTLFSPHGAPKSGVAFVDINQAKQMNLPGVKMDA